MPPNLPSSSRRVAIDNNIKMLRHMESSKYNGIIIKHLRLRCNSPILDKYQKKLMKSYFNMDAVKKEDLQNCKMIIMNIPRINYLIELMMKNCAFDEENIFRISVNRQEVEELEELVQRGEKTPNLQISTHKYTPHHFAALLKKYLFKFQDSLFPSRFLALYHSLQTVVEHEREFLESLQLINMLIPTTNVKLLRTIFILLERIIKSEKSNVDASFLAKMLYPCLFSSMWFDKKMGEREKKNILKDINTRIDILAKIIDTGVEGFKNCKCAEKDLINVYNETINNNNSLKKGNLSRDKTWISKHLKNNFIEGEMLSAAASSRRLASEKENNCQEL